MDSGHQYFSYQKKQVTHSSAQGLDHGLVWKAVMVQMVTTLMLGCVIKDISDHILCLVCCMTRISKTLVTHPTTRPQWH